MLEDEVQATIRLMKASQIDVGQALETLAWDAVCEAWADVAGVSGRVTWAPDNSKFFVTVSGGSHGLCLRIAVAVAPFKDMLFLQARAFLCGHFKSVRYRHEHRGAI